MTINRMSDLICRQATLDALCDNCDTVAAVCAHYPCKRYLSIENLPSAQPEIIRCKDCKNWDTTWTDFSPNYHYCPMVDGVRKDDWYCADAVEKSGQFQKGV